MISFLPFKGFIPAKDRVRSVAIRSTDYTSDDEIVEEMKRNNLAYLHVTKANLLAPHRTFDQDDYFLEARSYIGRLLREGHLEQDAEDTYYLYRQSSPSGTFVGIVGLCDVLDYKEDRIKRHENTRVQRERWVARLVDETQTIGEPVLIAHSDHPDIQFLIGQVIQRKPFVAFKANNGSSHEVWKLKGEDAEKIQSVFEQMNSVYIMDGHHRSASFARLHDEVDQKKYRYFLGMMLSSFNIRIWPFHRLVRLSDRSTEEFLDQISKVFSLTESLNNWPVMPDHKNVYGVYARGKWYTMTDGHDRDILDVSVLEEKIFGPILGITDSRTDERLDYIPGNMPVDDLVRVVDANPDQVLITLNPCQFEDIQRVSDLGETMPPKSTYIEPKGRSGLIIQKFD